MGLIGDIYPLKSIGTREEDVPMVRPIYRTLRGWRAIEARPLFVLTVPVPC